MTHFASKDGVDIKSKDIPPIARIIHNMYCHAIMPRGGTIEKVTDQDLLVYFLLMEKKEKLNLSYMIVKYMWKNMTTNRKDAWRGEPRKNKREEKLKKLFL